MKVIDKVVESPVLSPVGYPIDGGGIGTPPAPTPDAGWWKHTSLTGAEGDEITSWPAAVGADMVVPAGSIAPIVGPNGGVLCPAVEQDPAVALEAADALSGLTADGFVVVSALSGWSIPGALISSNPWASEETRIGISPWGSSNTLYGDWGMIAGSAGRVQHTYTPITDRVVAFGLRRAGGELSLWIDGVKVQSKNTSTEYVGGHLRLFAGVGTVNSADSEVFEVRVYSAPPSESDVQTIMRDMVSGSPHLYSS